MTAKEFVLQEYPKAWASKGVNCWMIISDHKSIGSGKDKSSAWTNAKNNIKEKDFSVNPNE